MKSLQASVVLALLMVVPTFSTAHARERPSVDGLLAAAETHARQGRVTEAARTFGQAVALAHRHKDLEEEARLRTPLEGFLAHLESPSEWCEALAAVIGELDARHAGAFVSAHALARELLLASCRSGERTGVPIAARSLTTYATGRKRGKAAEATAAFGEGLLLLSGDDVGADVRDRAAVKLEIALTACVEEHWFETATAIGTELAALWLSADDNERARAALARAVEASEEALGYLDLQVLITWSGMARQRLAGAPEEVLAPLHKALNALRGASSEPGGAGAAAASGDEEPCHLAKSWRRLKGRKDLVVVERKGVTHRIRLPFIRKHQVERVFRTGQRPLAADGVLLVFHGHAVTLAQISLDAACRAPGGGPGRAGIFAWYLLADGETWSVRKDGHVSISSR